MNDITNLRQSDPGQVINQLMTRYYARLKEAVAEADASLSFDETLINAGVKRPGCADSVTMDDFLNAVKALQHTGRVEGLGLRLGSRLRLSDYGLMGLATASSQTLGEAIKMEGSHSRLITPVHEVEYESSQEKGRTVVTLREFHGERWAEHYLIEQEIASLLRLIRDLLPDVDVKNNCRVSLAYPRPAYWQLYSKFLPCQIRFRQPRNQVSIPTEWLELPLQSSDPALARILDQQCQHIIDRLERQGGWVDRVRRLLLENRGKPPTLEQAAERLDSPVHTFRRRLYEAGTTYKQIAYSVRMELAADYLRDTSLPLQEIGFLLGYEHAPNFFSAFKKYWKRSPTQFRSGG